MRKIKFHRTIRLKRKHIKCPSCRGRLIDARQDTRTLVMVLSENDQVPMDYYMKCTICKSEIGLKML